MKIFNYNPLEARINRLLGSVDISEVKYNEFTKDKNYEKLHKYCKKKKLSPQISFINGKLKNIRVIDYNFNILYDRNFKVKINENN